MTTYLKFDFKEIENFFRQTKMSTIQQSKNYSIKIEKFLLIYHEIDDRESPCLTNDQIGPILQHLHDEHEHFSHFITLNRLKKKKLLINKNTKRDNMMQIMRGLSVKL